MGGDDVTTLIYNICAYLSGTLGIGVGILAVIYSGYEMLSGEIDKRKMLIRSTAIAFIIGGAYIAQNVLMKGIAG